MTEFAQLLREQVTHELFNEHYYLAGALALDGASLPQAAALFYRQAAGERGHAMMMARYLLDRGHPVVLGGLGAPPDVEASVGALAASSLELEKITTAQIETLARAAREEGSPLDEQFMAWFLKEQVEEEQLMSTLVSVAARCGASDFDVEDFIARELLAPASGVDPTAPPIAGGLSA